MPVSENNQILGENLLVLQNRITKFFDQYCNEAVKEYGFTPNEVIVLMFLANNAPLDSACDLIKYRKMSKSLVAKSVSTLIQKGLICSSVDEQDHRLIHLHLLPESSEIINKLHNARQQFLNLMYQGISEKEINIYASIVERIIQNLKENTEYGKK